MNKLAPIQRLFLLALSLMLLYTMLSRMAAFAEVPMPTKAGKILLGLLFTVITFSWYLRTKNSRHEP